MCSKLKLRVFLSELIKDVAVFISYVLPLFSTRLPPAVLDKQFVLIYSFSSYCQECQIFCSHTEMDTQSLFPLSLLYLYVLCVCVCEEAAVLCCRAGWPVGSPRCSPDEGVFTGLSLLLCPLVVCLVPQEQQALNWFGLWPPHPAWPVWAGEWPLPALENCPWQ